MRASDLPRITATGSLLLVLIAVGPAAQEPGEQCDGGLDPLCGSFSLSTVTVGYQNDLNPGPGNGCTGRSASGPDLVFRTRVAPGGSVNLTWTEEDYDGSIYLVTDCGDIEGTCLAGSDCFPFPCDNSLSYTNQSGQFIDAFLVIDGFGGMAGTGLLQGQIDCDPVEPACLSRQQVMDLVIDQVITGDSLEVQLVAFLFDPLGPDTTLAAGQVVRPWDSTFVEVISEPTYLVWIDRETQYEWLHSSAFVFVDACTGAFTVQPAESWPVVDGEEVEGDQLAAFFGSYEEGKVAFNYEPVATPNVKDRAIIFVGANCGKNPTAALNEKQARRNDIDRIRKLLNAAPLGPRVTGANFAVLPGADTLGATIAEVQQAITALPANTDTLHFFYIGHGAQSGLVMRERPDESSREKWEYDAIAQALLASPAKGVRVALEACHSGGAIKPFREAKTPGGAGNRLRGILATSSTKGNYTNRELDGAPFIKRLHDCFFDPLGDLNLDGRIDLLEGVVWARHYDPLVFRDDAQALALGQGSAVEFPGTREFKQISNLLSPLVFHGEVHGYKIERGKREGGNVVVDRAFLLIDNPSNRNLSKVAFDVHCIEPAPPTLLKQFRNLSVGMKTKIRLLAIPSGCKKIQIRPPGDKRSAPESPAGLAHAGRGGSDGVVLNLEVRAGHYVPESPIYQDFHIFGEAGDSYAVTVDSLEGWGLAVTPSSFTMPALVDSQTVIVHGTVPAGVSSGAEITAHVINSTAEDTTEISIDALVLRDEPGTISDGATFDHNAVRAAAGLVSSGPGSPSSGP
jgi:hypothetical protein